MKAQLRKGKRPMLLRSKCLRTCLLLSATLSATSCGTATKPNLVLLSQQGKQEVCVVLPVPDFTDPTTWMKNYDVAWHRLGCDQ